MPLMQRVVKPKTQRGKRALENRQPKLIENNKTTMLLRGSTASDVVLKFMKDVTALKKPDAVYFNRKKDWQPMENVVPVEMFITKYDSSLFMFGSHNKKRPHNIVMGRTYDGQILDMIEVGLENYKGLKEFTGPKIATGAKPCLLFAGELFDGSFEYQRLKNLLIDFFRGPQIPAVRLEGLEHVLMFTAVDGKVHLRCYKILLKKSGTKIPRIELEEMGPSVDFVMRRNKLASNDLFKRARKQPLQLKKKNVKNIKKDPFGTKLGRIHMGKQNLRGLQTRKLKGLRKTPEQKKLESKLKKHLKRKSDSTKAEGADSRKSKLMKVSAE